jgi:macrolide-specific efflux system membrane fusion protein
MAEMTTQVFFVAEQAKNVLTAPISALQAGTGTDNQTAQVVAKNGRIEQRDVRTGISDRLRVQVLDGLQEGDHLLIGPADGSGG